MGHRHREWGIESDSELSVLASSLFNSMDGTESSQGISAEVGNVEMSGTCSGLTAQDVQNDGIDTNLSTSIDIQGIGTSPRRTRSGKVVKYRD